MKMGNGVENLRDFAKRRKAGKKFGGYGGDDEF